MSVDASDLQAPQGAPRETRSERRFIAHFITVQRVVFFIPVTRASPLVVCGCCGVDHVIPGSVSDYKRGESYTFQCPLSMASNSVTIPVHTQFSYM